MIDFVNDIHIEWLLKADSSETVSKQCNIKQMDEQKQ